MWLHFVDEKTEAKWHKMICLQKLFYHLRSSKDCCPGSNSHLLALTCSSSSCPCIFALASPCISHCPDYSLRFLNICCSDRQYPHPSNWKIAGHMKIGQLSCRKSSQSTRQSWPWDLRHPQPSAVEQEDLGQLSSGTELPGTQWGWVCSQAWLTHSSDTFPFPRLRQILMRSWTFSSVPLCACSGAEALGRFLKSNYAYYWLGFQKPSLLAERINLALSITHSSWQPHFTGIKICTWKAMETYCNRNPKMGKRDLRMEREIRKWYPWCFQGFFLDVSVMGTNKSSLF